MTMMMLMKKNLAWNNPEQSRLALDLLEEAATNLAWHVEVWNNQEQSRLAVNIVECSGVAGDLLVEVSHAAAVFLLQHLRIRRLERSRLAGDLLLVRVWKNLGWGVTILLWSRTI